MKKILFILFAVCLSLPLYAGGGKDSAASSGSSLKTAPDAAAYLGGRNIRGLTGSTDPAGGLSLSADLFAQFVNKKYGSNIFIDPLGAEEALREIASARPDGGTIMMISDAVFFDVLSGAHDAADYRLEDFLVGGAYALSASESADKEYFLFYPKEMSADFIAAMDIAITDICNSQAYKDALTSLGFAARAKGSAEAASAISAKRDALSSLP